MSARSTPRRALAAAATALLCCVAVAQVAAADPIGPIDAAADAAAVAVRGASTQVEQPPGPPSHSGCLRTTPIKVSASIDPQQRWYVNTIIANEWKIAFYPVAGTRGPVAVVGDSLTYGAADSTMRELINAGYGPICVDGGVARRVVVSGNVTSGVQVIARIKASDPVWQMPVVRWVLALGTNDARASAAYVAGYSTVIQSGRNAVGTTTVPMYWIDLRTDRGASYYSYEDQWNARLTAPNTVVVPWAALADSYVPHSTLFAGDHIHLNGTGYTLRGQLTENTISAT